MADGIKTEIEVEVADSKTYRKDTHHEMVQEVLDLVVNGEFDDVEFEIETKEFTNEEDEGEE